MSTQQNDPFCRQCKYFEYSKKDTCQPGNPCGSSLCPYPVTQEEIDKITNDLNKRLADRGLPANKSVTSN